MRKPPRRTSGTGAKRGRKPLPLPPGIRRIVRTRDRIDFYADGWPESDGPTCSLLRRKPRRFVQQPGRRPVPLKWRPGRPRRKLCEAIALIILFERVRTYMAQGYKRESAVLAAMADFEWRVQRVQELERLLLIMRRGV
jgi:diadenosine tetraphosphatase ApaH/serine/threonine PP2A family protein phosphatase